MIPREPLTAIILAYQPPTPPRGPGYGAWPRSVLLDLVDGYDISEACERAEISRPPVYRLRQLDATFRALLALAIECGRAERERRRELERLKTRIEREMRRRAA